MKRFAVLLAVLAAGGLLGWKVYEKAALKGKGPEGRRERPAVAVEIAPVAKGDIRQVGQFTGTLYATSEFTVAPKIAGRLEKLLVHIGDRVEGGQLVAVLDDDEYRQETGQAEAELEVARANVLERENTLENSRREYDRTIALREKKIASASELDASESEYKNQEAKLKVALAQVSQREAALNAAKVRLSYATIALPGAVEGHWVVGERFVDEGALLKPNEPIVSVLDIGTLTAVIHVIERDYPKIKSGLAASVTADAYPGRVFSGRVLRIAPLVKEESREARVEIEVPNGRNMLKPGMFVQVQIDFDLHRGATLVPSAALVKREGTTGVFLADREAKTASFVPVDTGIVEGPRTEVLSPPLEGHVVTLGQHLLEDGAPIIVPAGAAAGKKP